MTNGHFFPASSKMPNRFVLIFPGNTHWIRHNQKLGIIAATDVLRQVVRGKYSQTHILVQSKVTRDQAIMPTRALSFSARKGRGKV